MSCLPRYCVPYYQQGLDFDLYRLDVSPAPAPAITLEQAYAHLRLTPLGSPPEHPDDALLLDKIQAVTDELESCTGWLGRTLVTQVWRMDLSRMPSARRFQLPLPPLQSVESIAYTDADGNAAVVDPSTYTVVAAASSHDTSVGYIDLNHGQNWPRIQRPGDRAVQVTFTAGYPDGKVPPYIRAYMLLRLGFLYEHRESVIVAPGALPYEMPGMNGMLENYRVRGLIR